MIELNKRSDNRPSLVPFFCIVLTCIFLTLVCAAVVGTITRLSDDEKYLHPPNRNDTSIVLKREDEKRITLEYDLGDQRYENATSNKKNGSISIMIQPLIKSFNLLDFLKESAGLLIVFLLVVVVVTVVFLFVFSFTYNSTIDKMAKRIEEGYKGTKKEGEEEGEGEERYGVIGEGKREETLDDPFESYDIEDEDFIHYGDRGYRRLPGSKGWVKSKLIING